MKDLNARIDAVLALESKVTRGALVEIHAAPPVQEFCMAAPEMAALIRDLQARIKELNGAAAEVKALRRALADMVSAQHAGPITREMYDAWEHARKLLLGGDAEIQRDLETYVESCNQLERGT